MSPDKVDIPVSDQDPEAVRELAWEAVLAANDPPTLFRRADGQLAQVEGGRIVALDRGRLEGRLEHVARWHWAKGNSGTALGSVPTYTLRVMLSNVDPRLPVVERVTSVPVLRADGTLLSEPGYDATSRTFHAPDPAVQMPRVSADPELDEIGQALGLFDELVADFPFADEPSRAHALTLFVLPFLRDLVAGHTPLHLIDKPTERTGATLLVRSLLAPAFGEVEVHPYETDRDETEFRKTVTSELLEGARYVVLDNALRLDSAVLAAAVTSGRWRDRVLGKSEIAHMEVRCIWAATGNNPRLSRELAGRAVRIRLDARSDRPELRGGFRHRLPDWALERRGELAWAALTLGRAWVAQRDAEEELETPLLPSEHPEFGGFEAWVRLMSGLLHVCGRASGFLAGSRDDVAVDQRTDELETTVLDWWEAFGETPVTTTQLLMHPTVGSELDLPGLRGDQRWATAFGLKLATWRDMTVRLPSGSRVAVKFMGRGARNKATYALQTVAQDGGQA